MTEQEKCELRRQGAPAGFEEEWRTSGKFRMIVADQRARERLCAAPEVADD